MEKRFIAFFAMALTLTACHQADKKQETNHHGMEHTMNKNVMMQAMDDSMIAMHKATQTGNPDYDFASMMIPHHKGAIVMAQQVLKSSKSESLIGFAKQVISEQQIEILQLEAFLNSASKEATKDASSFKTSLDKSMVPMMDGMANIKLTNSVDKDFVSLMILHHQSAVDMAKAYLPYNKDETMKSLADQIIKSQEEEIAWLKSQ